MLVWWWWCDYQKNGKYPIEHPKKYHRFRILLGKGCSKFRYRLGRKSWLVHHHGGGGGDFTRLLGTKRRFHPYPVYMGTSNSPNHPPQPKKIAPKNTQHISPRTQMSLVLVGKSLVLGGLTFKNRGHWDSRLKWLHVRWTHLGANQYMLVSGQEKATQAIAGPHGRQHPSRGRSHGLEDCPWPFSCEGKLLRFLASIGCFQK